ncbi:MAG TPA: YciI family protein [Steroidobacteraceae bacterium]|nr:YciI family protein [Steroidobacteraceae bacterium]
MKYMTFIRHSESYREAGPPKALMEAMDAFVQRLIREGAFVDGGGFKPSREGVRMHLAKGKLTVLDGPFTETKEVIGGYAILEAATRADALRIATEFMELHRRHWPEFEGEAEVRPMLSPGERP